MSKEEDLKEDSDFVKGIRVLARKEAHLEVLRYHFYGVRHVLVTRRNNDKDVLADFIKRAAGKEKLPLDVIEAVKANIANLDKTIKEADETIKKIGKFDTSLP